jgi:hypothetical protein
MHRDLIRRLTGPRTIAVAAAVCALAVAVPVLRAGPASADGAGAAFTATRCLSGDGWGATLSITAVHPERHPVGHISTAAGPYAVWVPAGGYSTLITGVGNEITVGVTLSWSDGATQDLGSVIANRPGDCGVSSAVATTPPTTTCTQAIPPRDDCGDEAATAPATTVPLTINAADARLDVGATLLALQTASASASPPPPAATRAATSRPAAALPATGSFPAALIAAGAAALVAGLALVTAGRVARRAR